MAALMSSLPSDRLRTDPTPAAEITSPAIERLLAPGAPTRVVIAGSAGSGKTSLLQRLATRLTQDAKGVVALRSDVDIEEVPVEAVLLADDVHLLDEGRLASLARRADDPRAGLVVTLRDGSPRVSLSSLARVIERSHPAILLGDVTRAQLRDRLGCGDPRCEDALIHLTGGIAWLVYECVAAHDPRTCGADLEHRELRAAVQPRIRHRLMAIDPALRRVVDDLALGRSLTAEPGGDGRDLDAVIDDGRAEGMLRTDGALAPIVADAARAVMPITRRVELVRTGSAETLRDGHLIGSLAGVRDDELVEALSARAEAEVTHDPELAAELFDQALACGANPASLTAARAHAAWLLGDLNDAGMLLDAARRDGADPSGLVADLTASVWAERGMMALADHTFRATMPTQPGGITRARIAAFGAGRLTTTAQPPAASEPAQLAPPSTLGIATALLDRGLASAFACEAAGSTLVDLQRASELFTASGDATPTVELPAVIAAVALIGVGDLKAAQTAIDDALHGGQGGAHRQPRLQLWSSWIALQRERPAEARATLSQATSRRPLSPRDEAFAAAIRVGLARRYEDAATLAAVWESEHARLVRPEPDLYALLPLGELVIAAARVGDPASMQGAFDRGLQIIAGLGDPPLWSAPLHWAGIQRGILLNRPDELAPHARALVAAAAHNRLAARMANAGRVWTAVLAGAVDPEAVETAARGLATVGLAWDGARLAGHGAGRSDDRKVIARLLACARELHPRETARATGPGHDEPSHDDVPADGILSEREREVAELVLQGRTYAEIGAAIFISPRTAEHHIAHIRRRLDATSRSDLLSKLRVALDGSAGHVLAPGETAT